MKIAVLTSGGVAPGMTAAVRAAAYAAFRRGWEAVVVEEGYYGLLEGSIRPVDRRELWGFVQQGGTALGTGPALRSSRRARRARRRPWGDCARPAWRGSS